MIINEHFPLKDTGSSSSENNLTNPRHRWYSFKEGFSPALVDYAIKQVGIDENDYILDPFNGSGTVTLTSAQLSKNSVGIEVNPFAFFLAKTKLANVTSKDVLREISKIKLAINNNAFTSPLINFSTFSQQQKLKKWLFEAEVLNSFHCGYLESENIKNISVKRIIKLALLNSALDNCNAIRDGKCFRYKTSWDLLCYNKKSLLVSFESIISKIVSDLDGDKIDHSNTRFISGDCRKILEKGLKNKFKLCITSPPYLNSFDYTDVYRPELFLGGFVKSQEELLNLRKQTLRSHALVKKSELNNEDLGTIFNNIISRLNFNKENNWQRKIPIMIQAYFEDMKDVLKSLYKNADMDAQLWLVVSNSAYNDYEIPVDLILADLASQVGWKLKEVGVLRNIHKRGSKYSPGITSLRESVIILSKYL